MSEHALLLTAAVTGLLGSTHCAGMCGGISAALSFALPESARKGPRLLAWQLAYNSGRLFTYTLLGFLAGLLAQNIPGGWAQSPWPRIVAAVFMVLLGLYLAGWGNTLLKLEMLGGKLWQHLQPLRKRLLPINHPLKAVAAGALWGFLPCGLVYSALTLALARADALQSAGIMLAFGLGTLPLLLLTGTLAGQLRQWLQQLAVRRVAGVCVILFGVWTAAAALMPGHAHHHDTAPETQHEHHHHD